MVYQRAIFDAFNEALTDIWSGGSAPDYVRLISLGKKPPRHTLANKEELEIVLCLAREQVLEVATSLCGMIRDKEDSVLGCIQEIDQAVLNQVREQRLVKMLARHVLNFDHRFQSRKDRGCITARKSW